MPRPLTIVGKKYKKNNLMGFLVTAFWRPVCEKVMFAMGEIYNNIIKDIYNICI